MATHSIDALVEQQARRWAKAHEDDVQKAPRPCIALSRLPYSGATELAIDEEVKNIVDLAYAECKGALTKHRPLMETMVERLLEEETLSSMAKHWKTPCDTLVWKSKIVPSPSSKPSKTIASSNQTWNSR